VEDLAEYAGIASSTLSNYEADKREPSLETIKLLSECMNVSPAYISGFIDTDDGQSLFPIRTVDPDELSSIFISATTLEKKQLRLPSIISFRIKDSLIEPDIMKNSEVLIDTTAIEINSTDIYAVRDESGHVRCLWGRKEIGRDEFMLYTNNDTHFPPLVFSCKDTNIKIIGRVVCVVTWR
jgi:transcriptional regulator with XRE-family HTH domain